MPGFNAKLAYADAPPLTDEYKARLLGLSTLSCLTAQLTSHGYTLDDLRTHPKTNGLVYPDIISAAIDAERAGNLGAMPAVSDCYLVGLNAIFRGLSKSDMNGKEFTIVKVFPDEGKVAIDMTAEGLAPYHVRYVKAPIGKIAMLVLADGEDRAVNAVVMEAANRDEAFSGAGFDLSKAVCLKSRPSPDVGPFRVFRDLPVFCAKLNAQRVPGSPFKVVFGFNVFAYTDWSKFKRIGAIPAERKLLTATYNAEPLIVLQDCNGCLIDVSTDIGSLKPDVIPKPHGILASAHPSTYKIFVPDKQFTAKSWGAMFNMIDNIVEAGWMPTSPWREDIDEWMANGGRCRIAAPLSGTAVDLGMIPGGLNSHWPSETAKSILCNPFKNCGIETLDKKIINSVHSVVIKQRRQTVQSGCVLLSRNMAIEVANKAYASNGAIVCRDAGGTICFACFTRLTVEESKVCGVCGKARYCSLTCQMWHFKLHSVCCLSTEERERRRDATDKAKKERVEQIRRHDEREALSKAEEVAKEAEYKAVVARERARRADQNAADVEERERRAVPHAQPQVVSGKDRSARRTAAQQLVHVAYVSDAEKAARTAAFVAHQDLEHVEAVARKAKDKADYMKKLQSDIEKDREAVEHHVPPPQSIASAVSDAMQLS